VIASAEEFARLRCSEDPAEYQRAANDEAPLQVWLAVIEKYPALREWVTHNKTVPIAVLEQLARDPSPGVRATVAARRKLNMELQELLASDVDASVRVRLAYNAKCSDQILQRLSEDPEEVVRAAAIKKLGERNRVP
jgi:hypothetical protein